MNGSGKSTIATAIEKKSRGESLSSLQPFGATTDPDVAFSEPISKVLVFNEDFVNSVVFVESEVIQNAFDVFVRTPKYDERRKELDESLRAIQLETISTPDFDTLRKTGNAVLSKFSLTSSGQLKQTGLIKSLVTSENIFQLPREIRKFQPLMDDSEHSVEWVGWKIQGAEFDGHAICPFCSEALNDRYPDEKALFEKSYTKSNVKNIREMLQYFSEVEEYMDESKRDQMFRCIRESNDPKQIKQWVLMFYNDLKYLMNKVRNVTEFGTFRLHGDDISMLTDKLASLKISIEDLLVFNNAKVASIIDSINERIDQLIAQAESLKKQIGELNGAVNSAMKSTVRDVNSFLKMADIPYRLDFRGDGEEETQAFLKYVSPTLDEIEVEQIKVHLSWGERNAFALVLFMHFALSQNADIVVLDDPISSFDDNKKYAIINRLFQNSTGIRSFYKRTVLMLTHDFQPIIDFIVNGKPHGQASVALYFKNNRGAISAQPIKRGDIESLPILLVRSAKDRTLNAVHRVVSLRKLIEHTTPDHDGNLAYNILSCLVHGKKSATYVDETPIADADLAEGERTIKSYLSDFSYALYRDKFFSRDPLVAAFQTEKVPYFRLQIFRVLIGVLDLRSKFQDDPLLKYIDEQFHVENDYLFYLDLSKFDTVPSFVIESCEAFLRANSII
jgi:wobble nucleotide-excising tRNase